MQDRGAKIAEFYAKLWEYNPDPDEHSSFKDAVREFQTRTRIDSLAGLKAIDVGCGTGRIAYALATLGAETTAVDLTELNLSFARKNTEGLGVTVRREDICNLSFPDESFDFVWCNGVIHHTLQPDRAFAEVARIVKPGGRLFVGLYSKGFQTGVFPRLGRLVGKYLSLSVTMRYAAKRYPVGSKEWHDFLNIVASPSPQYRYSWDQIVQLYRRHGFHDPERMNPEMTVVIPPVTCWSTFCARMKFEWYWFWHGGRMTTWYDAMGTKRQS